MKVTIFKTIYEKSAPHTITLSQALQRIKNGKSRTTVDAVRSGQKEKKMQLPAVLFSGEFSSRADDNISEHSGYIVLASRRW